MATANGYSSLATMSPQGRWRRVLLITFLPTLCVLLYYIYRPYSPLSIAQDEPSRPSKSSQPDAQPPPSGFSQPQNNASQPVQAQLSSPSPCPTPPMGGEDLSMTTVVEALFRPNLHPIDAANFTDEDGAVHRLPGEPRFKEKLGKRVLILDVDSRPLTGDGQILNEELEWKGTRPLSAGMLSHYMFGTECTVGNSLTAH